MSEITIVKTAKTGKIAKRLVIESKKHELKVVVVKD